MKKKTVSLLMILILTLTLFTACGRGGGGGGGSDNGPAAPTQAVVTIMTTGTLDAGTMIGGIDVTVNLPVGVSVKATPDPVNTSVAVTDAGVVTASGVSTGTNTTGMGTYTFSPNAVSVKVINPSGFTTGEFVTITCDIAAGTTVTETEFLSTALSAVDLNGAAITGLTAGMAVRLL